MYNSIDYFVYSNLLSPSFLYNPRVEEPQTTNGPRMVECNGVVGGKIEGQSGATGSRLHMTAFPIGYQFVSFATPQRVFG